MMFDGITAGVNSYKYPASCMLKSNDGIILSMCTGFQMLHCRSSVTVLRTTP